MALQSGARLGVYEILGPLGAGGMGEVYRARDTRLGREIAIKVLPAEVASSPERLARLEREARTVAGLNHPNIVTLHSVEDVGGVRFLTMELVEGETLTTVIPPGGLPLPRLLELAIPLADALIAAHEKGVVHRDLKPGNVMVTGEGRVKVLDFGIARRKVADDSEAPATRTMAHTGSIVGTPGYLAPEVLRGSLADSRSDLWSLGVMLYEMASGARPFKATTEAELASAILHDTPEALPARVPPGLAAVVARCLAKDPAQRYRQAGEVRAALEALGAGGSSKASRARRHSGSAPRFRAWAVAVAAVLAGAVVFFGWRAMKHRAGAGAGGGRIASIAVLPLESFSSEPEQAYFADGMTEELIATLAQVESLRVISRTSVMGFKGTTKAIPEIGKALGVDGIVEGSVRRSGDRVRITAQLIRVARDEHIWASSYERDIRDVLALQQEVARAIVGELRLRLTSSDRRKIAAAPAVSPQAYDFYLRGVAAYRRWDERGRQAAKELLGKALEIDSTYAPAWASLAYVYLQDAYGLGARSPTAVRAREALTRALTHDPDLAMAHSVKGVIAAEMDWDWAGAEREFRRAIDAAPSSFEPHHSYSHLLMSMGRVEESFRESRIAVALDPLNTAATLHLGWHYIMAGETERAIPEYLATLRIDPSYSAAYNQIAWAYLLTGRHADADKAYRKYVELSGTSDALAVGALIAAQTGRTEDAARMVDTMIARANRGDFPSYDVASALAMMGRTEEAFQWLERAIDRRESAVVDLQRDPFLRALREDPRFPALVRRVGLPFRPL
jgi:TolB-like protein/Tfp pilus assembly protein PilF